MNEGLDSPSNVNGVGIARPLRSGWVIAQCFGLVRQFGSTLIWASVVGFLIREAGRTLRAYAGRTSIANVILSLSAHVNITVVISVTLAGVTSLLWGWEIRRHRRTRERLTGRITKLELLIDPGRKSSLLTPLGTTREGDL